MKNQTQTPWAVELVEVEKYYSSKKIVDKISLKIHCGEFFSLLGPSGCGKTTTLRMIAGLEKNDSGLIKLQNKEVSSKNIFIPPEKRNLGMVFQSYALWPHMTVEQNILYPLKMRKVSQEIKNETLQKMLKLVDLKNLENRYPHELSGGQQQRVALARAVSFGPDIVLMDEPLSNLDTKLRLELRGELKTWQKELGVTIVYVTHDHSEAFYLSDHLAIMNLGKLAFVGTPNEVQDLKGKSHPFINDFLFSTEV